MSFILFLLTLSCLPFFLFFNQRGIISFLSGCCGVMFMRRVECLSGLICITYPQLVVVSGFKVQYKEDSSALG